MKRYSTVYELEAELIVDGFIKDKDIEIPADESSDGDPDAGCLIDAEGRTLYSYPKFKAYFINN